MGEDGPDDGGPGARAPAQVPRDDGDARQLPRAPRHRNVPEQPHAEGGEDNPPAWPRRRDGVLDDHAPGRRPHGDGEEVDRDREPDPEPRDRAEGVADTRELRMVPDEEGREDRQERDDERHATGAACGDRQAHY